MSDLVERLRFNASAGIPDFTNSKLLEDAAARIEALEAALEFYANPETYHAIAILGDYPCGEFAEDFSDDEWTRECGYERPMPGKFARAALDKDAGK